MALASAVAACGAARSPHRERAAALRTLEPQPYVELVEETMPHPEELTAEWTGSACIDVDFDQSTGAVRTQECTDKAPLPGEPGRIEQATLVARGAGASLVVYRTTDGRDCFDLLVSDDDLVESCHLVKRCRAICLSEAFGDDYYLVAGFVSSRAAAITFRFREGGSARFRLTAPLGRAAEPRRLFVADFGDRHPIEIELFDDEGTRVAACERFGCVAG